MRRVDGLRAFVVLWLGQTGSVAEPALEPGGALADSTGWLVGTEPGSGMALMMVLAGLLGIAVCLSGYAIRPIAHIERELPDHDAEPETGLAVSR